MRFLTSILVALLFAGCPAVGYRSWFTNVTAYRYTLTKAKKTAGGVRYFARDSDDTAAFRVQLDKLTQELKACLAPKWVVRLDWFAVLVPDDWYVSKCSGQQLVPSIPPCSGCRTKGLDIPDKCCGLRTPTKDCPCVCNMRAVVQDNYVVVTAPNLLLYKAELARLVTNNNNVWGVPEIRKCL